MVKLWDTETGDIIHTFKAHKEGINDIAWSCDGEFLASASDDKSIIVWSLGTVSSCRPQATIALILPREKQSRRSMDTRMWYSVCASAHIPTCLYLEVTTKASSFGISPEVRLVALDVLATIAHSTVQRSQSRCYQRTQTQSPLLASTMMEP